MSHKWLVAASLGGAWAPKVLEVNLLLLSGIVR